MDKKIFKLILILCLCLNFTAAEEELQEKSLATALTYTAIFPGWGHYYIEDYPKAIALGTVSAFMLYNLASPYTTARETYQQVYLVYWLLSLFDVGEETKQYNQKINEDELLSVSLYQYNF